MRKCSIKMLLCGAVVLAASLPTQAVEYDPMSKDSYRIDGIGRVLEVSGRKPVRCLPQSEKTAVILVIGQSNTGNYAEARFTSAHPARAINFFKGNCYPVSSPLLGTDGLAGESWSLFADKALDAGLFDRIVLITAGIGGTEIARWRAGGDLNRMLMDVIQAANGKYRITHVFWHQGESDLFANTATDDYVKSFGSLVSSLRNAGVTAPIFPAVASKCGGAPHLETWGEDDSIVAAQRKLPDASKGIYAGPDTNSGIPPEDRYDKCHFAKSGQEKFADAWVNVLKNFAGVH